MIGYYLALAWRSLRRNVVLTILMIVAIAFGVGASMTTLTVLHVLSADPIPQKSDRLYYVQLDPKKLRGVNEDPAPNRQMTLLDGQNLLRAKKAKRQALMTGGNAGIDAQRPGLPPFFLDDIRQTTADFFPMFDVPFIAGTGWTAEDDDKASRVCVISKALAEKVFGSTNVIGKTIRVEKDDLRVIGVTDTWRPVPHFYDLNTDTYGKGDQLFVPLSTSLQINVGHSGNTNCWDEHTDSYAVGAPCEWLQFWVEFDTPEQAAAYKDYLVAYSQEQKRAGKYERDPNVRLPSLMEWLKFNDVVPDDARLQTWIALGFLLVCLVNTVGLLLTKFLRRSADIGVRRALGASKRAIFVQLLVEAGVVGFVGGVLGLALAWLGLWAVRHQPATYADLARLDLPMLFATFGLAIVTSLLAGLLPAWRGCVVAPASQLKSH
jgi:putative ABC transport system permease protein